ncbi:MAG: DUF1080 domain-containing protein [Candidatus Omnitrophica bacterium]|nr:DUF1080 domain-containing protein [Candidatus Omnitrophota bacterium]
MKIQSTAALCGLAAIMALTACNSLHHETSSSPVELFNGKNLDGWKFVLADPNVKPEEVWHVKEGVIICKGTPLGFLYSDLNFTNFRLVVEYRWPPGSKPGNSGVFSRIHQPFSAIPSCAEVQLQHGNAGDIMTLQGMKLAADQPRYFSVKKHELAGDIGGVKKIQDQEKPPGEWNRIEILAQGPKYTVWLNGQKGNEAEGVEVIKGPVGLQSEGGEIEFRRVALTPLE